jgi:hypothetical protein
MLKKDAQIHCSPSGSRPVVELVVPQGTHIRDLLKVQEAISKELLPKIGPRGCAPCISGFDFRIREELEQVINVDLASAKFGN